MITRVMAGVFCVGADTVRLRADSGLRICVRTLAIDVPDRASTIGDHHRQGRRDLRDRHVSHVTDQRRASRGVNDPTRSTPGSCRARMPGSFTPRLALHHSPRGALTGGTARRPLAAMHEASRCVDSACASSARSTAANLECETRGSIEMVEDHLRGR